MPAKKMLHVITDRTGQIVGAALFDESEQTRGVSARLVPLKGQRLVKIKLTSELGKLEAADDFRRLISEFHVPRASESLVRKRAKATAKKRRRAS